VVVWREGWHGHCQGVNGGVAAYLSVVLAEGGGVVVGTFFFVVFLPAVIAILVASAACGGYEVTIREVIGGVGVGILQLTGFKNLSALWKEYCRLFKEG